MSITDKLDEFMKKHGYNKADVARLSGIPYTTIDGLYKKGDENTKLSTLRRLSKVMNCTLDELIDDSQGYYNNPEAAKIAQEAYDNPDLRILFDASRDVSPEDLKFVIEMVKRMKKQEEPDVD